jgi:hypothetical protein
VNRFLIWVFGATAVMLLPVLGFLWYQGANELSRFWTGRAMLPSLWSAPQRPPEGPNLSNCQPSAQPSPWRYCIVAMITHSDPTHYGSRPGNILFYNPATGAMRLMLDNKQDQPVIFQHLPGRSPAEASPGLLVSLLPVNSPGQSTMTQQALAVVKPDGTGLRRLDLYRSDLIRTFHTADEGLSLLVRDGTQVRQFVLDAVTLETKSREIIPPERVAALQRIPAVPNPPPRN